MVAAGGKNGNGNGGGGDLGKRVAGMVEELRANFETGGSACCSMCYVGCCGGLGLGCSVG